jgi:hypothetical protein
MHAAFEHEPRNLDLEETMHLALKETDYIAAHRLAFVISRYTSTLPPRTKVRRIYSVPYRRREQDGKPRAKSILQGLQ